VRTLDAGELSHAVRAIASSSVVVRSKRQLLAQKREPLAGRRCREVGRERRTHHLIDREASACGRRSQRALRIEHGWRDQSDADRAAMVHQSTCVLCLLNLQSSGPDSDGESA